MPGNVDQGTITVQDAEGRETVLRAEPLSEADMVVQAMYHLFLKQDGYRRELVCRECRAPMVDAPYTQVNEATDTWEMMARCACRAIYGTIALRRLHSILATSTS